MDRWCAVVVVACCCLAALACDPESEELEPESESRAAELWESIDGYQAWSPVLHGHQVQIHAEALSAIEGKNLDAEAEVGHRVVCEQYDQGELQTIEAFERVEHDDGPWYSVRYTADGVPLVEQFRAGTEPEPHGITCGDCHLGH